MLNNPNLARLSDTLTDPEQLGDVIDELIALSADYQRYYNDLLLQKSRYLRDERDYRRGSVTLEQHRVDQNRLIESIQYYIQKLDAERASVHPPFHTPLPPIPEVTPSIIQEGIDETKTNEAILGVNNFRNIYWLQQGISCSDSVCRVLLPNGGFGTGFLIGNDLMMTCHHVIPDASVASNIWVEFNYQEDRTGRYESSYRYRVKQLIISDKTLDYSVVKLDVNGAEHPLSAWGTLVINPNTRPVYKELVTIIQHPNGGLKRIVLTNSYVYSVPEPYISYVTDTLGGSSGSPVFNDVWQVIAVHHGTEKIAEKSEINRGTLVSAIVAHAKSKGITIK